VVLLQKNELIILRVMVDVESGICYDETTRCRDVTRHERCTKSSMYQYAHVCKRSCGLCGRYRHD